MERDWTPNQELTADQFNDLQINAPTIMEDCGIVGVTRVLILHLEGVAADHADLDADFTHLDGEDIDWRFEACGRCMDLATDQMFERMIEKLKNEE